MLEPADLAAIRAIVHDVASRFPYAAPPAPGLTEKLTVEEFAFCVQRSPYSIRQHRRLNRKFRTEFCEGAHGIKIHPRALAEFGVDSGLASARLQQFRARSMAISTDKAEPLSA